MPYIIVKWILFKVFLFYLLTYLFVLGCAGSFATGLCSSCGQWGLLLAAVSGVISAVTLMLQAELRLQASVLRLVGSAVGAPRLGAGSVAVDTGFAALQHLPIFRRQDLK